MKFSTKPSNSFFVLNEFIVRGNEPIHEHLNKHRHGGIVYCKTFPPELLTQCSG